MGFASLCHSLQAHSCAFLHGASAVSVTLPKFAAGEGFHLSPVMASCESPQKFAAIDAALTAMFSLAARWQDDTTPASSPSSLLHPSDVNERCLAPLSSRGTFLRTTARTGKLYFSVSVGATKEKSMSQLCDLCDEPGAGVVE